MSYRWRDAFKESLPAILGTILAVLGFLMMRVSAMFESWPLLFASFIFMVWGIVLLFNGGWKTRRETWGAET